MKKTLITLIALAGIAHADFTWDGGSDITQQLWQTESSWIISESDSWPAAGTGPGTPNSNAWSLISVSNASGSITQLEGWTLKLALSNGADLTVGNVKKFQGGCTINIDQSSALTINGFSGGNDGGITTLNNYGTFNLAYSKSQGGEGFNVNLGATGVMNLTSSNGNSYNAKIASLTATLTLDGGTASGVTADGHQILTRNLVSLGDNMSFDGTNTSLEMLSGIAGVDTLTAVDDLTNAEVGSYMVTKNGDGYSVSYVVPEPAAASLSPLGLAGLAMRRRRK